MQYSWLLDIIHTSRLLITRSHEAELPHSPLLSPVPVTVPLASPPVGQQVVVHTALNY